jgi:hypothetical protein
MITARFNLSGDGASNTSALAFGGMSLPSFTRLTCTEAYDGTLWSAGGAMITARSGLAGAGTNTAALAFGGYNGNNLSCTETYNESTTTTTTKTFDYSNTTGQITATGSLFGSASFANTATTATSASFATNATSASFASNATSASFATTATSASFATTATSASFATNANIATSSSFATNAASASFALSASYAPVSGFPFTGSANITGSLNVIGTTTTTTLVETSALRYKENITDLESADIIYQLRPVSFDWKANHKPDIGFIAEEINSLIPILAELNEDGEVEGVKYSKITTLLTKIVQNHQDEIIALKANINTLTEEINNLKNK